MKSGGKVKRLAEAEWWRKNFPTQHARQLADEAADKLDPGLSMQAFIDCWIAAYKKAGGRCDI